MRAKPILMSSSILRSILLSLELETLPCLELETLLGLELETLPSLELETLPCLELETLLCLELDTLLCSCSPALELFPVFLLLLAPVPASCKNSHFFLNLQLPFLRTNFQGILCLF